MTKIQSFIFQIVIQLDLTIYLVVIGLQYLYLLRVEYFADTADELQLSVLSD